MRGEMRPKRKDPQQVVVPTKWNATCQRDGNVREGRKKADAENKQERKIYAAIPGWMFMFFKSKFLMSSAHSPPTIPQGMPRMKT